MPAKGTTQSEEITTAANQTKHQTLLSKMKWDVVDSYLDIEIKNGSANRSKTHITIGEYKSSMLAGITQEEMRDAGISKHLIQFLSNFCQGKIPLTKEAFIKDYEAGKELDEIARIHKVTREDLGFLRQLYGIKRKGASFQARKATEIRITQRQRELIYGSLMGDAKKTSLSAVGFGQGGTQREYLFWKYNEMFSVACVDSLKRWPYKDKRSGYEGESWRFYTHANTYIEEIVKQFYGEDSNSPKDVNQSILDELTPFSIAVWFMDDGTTDFYWRGKGKPLCSICTDSFSQQSCLMIQELFQDKFGISTRLTKRKLKTAAGYRIVINNESVDTFFSLIRPHIIPQMLYKIDYEEYCKKRSIGVNDGSAK